MRRFTKAVVVTAAIASGLVIFVVVAVPGRRPSVAAPQAAPLTSPVPTPTLAPNERIITEAQLNQQVRQALQQRTGAVPFSDVHVSLKGEGRAELSAVTSLAGNDVPVQVAVAVQFSRGVWNIDVVGAQAGALPVPPGLADALATLVAQAVGLPGLKGVALPPEVRTVTIRPGAVVLAVRP